MTTRREFLFASSIAAITACSSRYSLANSADTGYIDALLAPGGNIVIPAGMYDVDYIRPRSGSVITIEQGAVFQRTYSPFSLLDCQNIEDVVIDCNEAVFDGNLAASKASHTAKLLGTRNVRVNNPHIVGSKSRKDGVYFGLGERECYDSHITGGIVDAADRNGVSFIAAIRCSVSDMEIMNTTWRHGVGVEANNHSYLNIENVIRRCKTHDNAGSGIVVSFGDRTTVDDNDAYDNSKYGIITASAGATRQPGVLRPYIDAVGIEAFDSQTGLLFVGGELSALQVGTVVYMVSPKNGAMLPLPLKQGYYQVTSVENGGIRLGGSVDYQQHIKFNSEAIGNLDPDPAASDFVLRVFGKHGQSDGTSINGNRCQNNKKGGIWATTSKCSVTDNQIHDNGGSQLRTTACEALVATGNIIYNGPSHGIWSTLGYKSTYRSNDISGVSGDGMNLTGCSNSVVLGNQSPSYSVTKSANVQGDF